MSEHDYDIRGKAPCRRSGVIDDCDKRAGGSGKSYAGPRLGPYFKLTEESNVLHESAYFGCFEKVDIGVGLISAAASLDDKHKHVEGYG